MRLTRPSCCIARCGGSRGGFELWSWFFMRISGVVLVFHDITERLSVLVFFAPAESG